MFETTNQLIISDIHTCYPNDIDQPVIYRMRSMVALGQSLGHHPFLAGGRLNYLKVN